MNEVKKPKWTVHYNIVSPENNQWVGTGWEFFDNEDDAKKAAKRNTDLGNCVGFRPYHDGVDRPHLGAAHLYWIQKSEREVS
jgi:hypothetical protein